MKRQGITQSTVVFWFCIEHWTRLLCQRLLCIEASTEKLERVPNKAVEQKKKITSEKAGSPKTEQKAKKKDTASEKTGIPKTEQKAKKKDTASEKTGTPKTEQKAKKENTASEKVGTPKTDLRKKITACDPGGEQQDSERIIILDVL